MKVLIVDIRFKHRERKIIEALLPFVNKRDIFFSLTPSASYYLDQLKVVYETFHDILPIEAFTSEVLQQYHSLDQVLKKPPLFAALGYEFCVLQSYEVYAKILIDHLVTVYKKKGISLVYITDVVGKNAESRSEHLPLLKFGVFDKVYTLQNTKDFVFYFFQRLRAKLFMLYRFLLKPKKIFYTILGCRLSYDNAQFYHFFARKKACCVTNKLEHFMPELDSFYRDVSQYIDNNVTDVFVADYIKILDGFIHSLKAFQGITKVKIWPFVMISGVANYARAVFYKLHHIPVVITQHGGNYINNHFFLDRLESLFADVNLVISDFTKDQFIDIGAKQVKKIGSAHFKYPINPKNKNIAYDFIYITYCAAYTFGGATVSDKQQHISFDAMNIYQRHKRIIMLFGKQLPEFKLCIKLQVGMIYNQIYFYSPLIELAKPFSNITIEFFWPLPKLIQKSRVIISDYHSSEFINRDVLMYRNILLFDGVPYSLPKQYLDIVKKVAVLCNDDDDLKSLLLKLLNDYPKKVDVKTVEYLSASKPMSKNHATQMLNSIYNNL